MTKADLVAVTGPQVLGQLRAGRAARAAQLAVAKRERRTALPTRKKKRKKKEKKREKNNEKQKENNQP